MNIDYYQTEVKECIAIVSRMQFHLAKSAMFRNNHAIYKAISGIISQIGTSFSFN